MSQQGEPFGVVIGQWACPVGWHKSVKWYGGEAYCIEPGCSRSNVAPETDETPIVRMVARVPRGVVTIELPER